MTGASDPDMMISPVAVVGMSTRLPGCDGVADTADVFAQGRTVEVPMADRRGELLGITDYGRLLENTLCITDIEQFDKDFFGMSHREARELAPESRLLLEHGVRALWDAGVSLNDVRGTRCGVISAQSSVPYRRLTPEPSTVSYLESLPALGAAHLAHFLDLRGPCFCVDSTCSSSLLAVHQACELLTSGQTDMMLAAGIQLYLPLDDRDHDELFSGRHVTHAQACAYDAESKGFISGEGVAVVVLKRLRDAERDGDHIRGVILGSAMSGNGARSASTFAPSAEAQSQAILEACCRAGVRVDDITEIEGHGAGTHQGDGDEVAGLAVFADSSRAPIPLSTTKPSIGHSGSAAGIASVVKVLVGFEHDVIYPVANLRNPNPGIDFAGSGVRPVVEVEPVDPTQSRVALVSSFGMSGLNVALIVQKAPPRAPRPRKPVVQLLRLSAESVECLDLYRSQVRGELLASENEFADVVDTLAFGRDDLPVRLGFAFHSPRDALFQLDNAVPRHAEGAGQFVVDLRETGGSSLAGFVAGHPWMGQRFEALGHDGDPALRATAAMLLELADLDLVPSLVIGPPQRLDQLVALVPPLRAATHQALPDGVEIPGLEPPYVVLRDTDEPPWNDHAFADLLVRSYLCGLDLRWSAIGGRFAWHRTVLPQPKMVKEMIWPGPERTDPCGDAVSGRGRSPRGSVRQALAGSEMTAVGLGPGFYTFDEDPLSPWTRDISQVPVANGRVEVKETAAGFREQSADDVRPGGGADPGQALPCTEARRSRQEVEARICAIWADILESDDVFPSGPDDLDETFFALGGNSLLGSMVIDEVNKVFGTELLLKDVYELDTVRKMADRVLQAGAS